MLEVDGQCERYMTRLFFFGHEISTSEIARTYSGFCDDDRCELAALLQDYMVEEDGERSGSDSEVNDGIVSSNEEADFDM